MPKKTAYLSSGQFAGLVGVSKHTLYFYDEEGLFKPILVKDNGYRYYSIRQVETFSVISSLKDIGMPLDDIKQYLNNRSPEQFVTLLDTEAEKLKRKIDELSTLYTVMEEKKKLTSETLKHELNEYIIEETSPRYYYLTEVSNVLDTKAYYESYQRHYSTLKSKTRRSSWLEGLMVPTSEITNQLTRYKGYIYTELETPQHSNFKLNGNPYLVNYIRGDDEAVLDGYRDLKQYALEQGYGIGDYFFEDLVLDELSIKEYDKYVYKLSMQIIGY
ncbi:MerR family transcriptional regulator [Alkalibacterium olivapovliticus]|uniref:DNA-binding transcriptional MerR regulator n=1 Tax=Alkalibacterium olivapovliticus TaxID=99907 RepID=A0A2T0VZQ3_9LACT|nr:MerR family transcriptional regulator [Alkalibacterium olivapovliticus]PRY78023.1 DNA-binding transcriptional MerR regulator [Alkalibacterium olivapovliticus]